MKLNVSWNDFKNFTVARNLSVQHFEIGNKYYLFVTDGPMSLSSHINIETPPNNDQIDFETNFKPSSNKKLQKMNNEGYIVTAPTFEDAQGLTTTWKGHLYTALPNSLNIFDEVVTTQLKLRGGWYKILTTNTAIGDYIEFSIVDKDNVLGLFSYFELTLGQDVLELKKFVKTEYISPLNLERQDFQTGGASEVMAGLYFRVAYYNSSVISVQFTVTEKYHET